MSDPSDPPIPAPPASRAQPPGVGRFAHIETSDINPLRGDGLGTFTVVAPTLGTEGRPGRGDVTYWLPRDCEALTDLPVVVLLHGVYASHWAWSNKAGAHLTAQRMIEAGDIL